MSGDDRLRSNTEVAGKKIKKEAVKVCVRLRPLNRLETRTGQQFAWGIDGNSIVQQWFPEDKGLKMGVATKVKTKTPINFAYDYIFNPDDTNETIFEKVGYPIIDGCMQGFHGCIFAYGQTSSGKTYTIHGSPQSPGMIPLSVEQVFQTIEDTPDREFVLRVSYMEIYNEVVNDLLNASNTNLKIREDVKRGVYVENLKEDIVMSPEQVYSLLQAGTSHRHVGRTNYNDVSSRSHTIFRIVIESSPRDDRNASVRYSALNLVDLAGSENAVKAGSEARIQETGYINKSLLTLGHVIFKLSEASYDHIPYRDSKLTRILTASLSGKARVAIVCNVSPSSGNLEESISTLKFANRAKKVEHSASVNEKVDDSALLKKYREEIDRLKLELDLARQQTQKMMENEFDEVKQKEEFQLIMEQNEAEKAELNEKIEQLRKLILSSSRKPLPSPVDTTASNSSADTEGHPAPSSTKVASMPTVRKGKSTERAMLYGTLPRGFTGFQTMRRSSSHDIRPRLPPMDEDTPLTNGSTLDERCDPAEPKASDFALNFSDDDTVESLRAKLVKMKMALDSANRRAVIAEGAAKALDDELEQKNTLLQEWDSYYVTNSNKQAVLHNELRRVAAKTADPELHQLFETLNLGDDFDAPLVDIDPRSPSNTSLAGPTPPGKERPPFAKSESSRFMENLTRFKSMEQE